VKDLPAPLTVCRVPQLFSPSQLVGAEHCSLRAVLGSTGNVPALVAHPAAAIGRVFHRLLELAVRGAVKRAGTPEEDAERLLDRLLQDEQTRLAKGLPGPVPDLRHVLPPAIWHAKRRAVVDLAAHYVSGVLPRAPGAGPSAGIRAQELPDVGRWSEIRMEDPELRLRGRADMIERQHATVVVRDLKTGRVLSDAGEILPHIELQMRLYGVMARRIWPRVDVRLVVDDGLEHEVAFGQAEEDATLAWLTAFQERLRPDSTLPAHLLATPGDACEGCQFRHLCPAYRDAAPAFWQRANLVRMPLDIWGSVVGIAITSETSCDVTVIDAENRRVKVFGLLRSRVEGMPIGRHLWLFGLRTSDRRRGQDGWRHPRNFYEVAEHDPYARAWSLESFGDHNQDSPDATSERSSACSTPAGGLRPHPGGPCS
jgi:RecB family exonuclease